MGRWSNIFFMIVPEKLVGIMLLGMIVGAGFSYIFGARKTGRNLLVTAIAMPFIFVITDALFNELFASLPSALVMPLAVLIIAIFWLVLAFSLVVAIFGQRAVDHAKGQFLYDATKQGFKILFSRIGLVGIAGLLLLSWLSIAGGAH